MGRRISGLTIVTMVAGALVVTLPVAGVAHAEHPRPAVAPAVGMSPQWSTMGDYATDMFGDPWDFSNQDDVPPIPLVSRENPEGEQIGPGNTANSYHEVGVLRYEPVEGPFERLVVDLPSPGSRLKLVRHWDGLPWGRDGGLFPIDAGTYRYLSMDLELDHDQNMGISFTTESGVQGFRPIYPKAGRQTITWDLADLAGGFGVWSGKVVALSLFKGGEGGPVRMTLDWVSIHRDPGDLNPTGGLRVKVKTPNVEGGADYATVAGNPWDFEGPDDVIGSGHIANASYSGGALHGQTVGNDSFVELPLPVQLVPDRYHRFTAEVCYDGQMSFLPARGGGMNARVAFSNGDILPNGMHQFSETQDIVIYPGCHRMTFDLSTTPPVAVNDENTVDKFGWRGQRIARLRFDLNEDEGVRGFSLHDLRLADDAAFSTSYPITFGVLGASGAATAEVYATTNRGAFDGVRIGTIGAGNGDNTFVWNGTNAQGQQMPNATYWIYVKVASGGSVATNYATGPLRLERPLPPTPSYFVPLNPVRLLDTRDGTGGNIVPLGPDTYTELDIAGRGGVPPAGATAVVLNVAVTGPSARGYITAWPSGEQRPLVASLNYVPGQTVPNLVTVKLGANGKVNLFNYDGRTSVIADVAGYYTDVPPPGGGLFTPLVPKRILDTRDGTGRGGARTPIGAGQTIDVAVTGVGGVPQSGVSGVALNVTVDQPTADGYLNVWPAGEPRHATANLNFVANQTVGNMVIAKVGAGGRVSIFNYAGTAHAVADVIGYFSAAGGQFVPVTPTRLVDSRFGIGMGGPLGQGQTATVTLANGSPVPPAAKGVVVNVTAVDSTAGSYLTAWPTAADMPLAATLNPRAGVDVPNLAYLKLGPGGRLDLFNYAGSTQIVVDVFGYIT